MDQLFVDRVVGGVCRIKLPPPRRAPGVAFGDALLEYDLDLCPRRNLRCNLRRNGNLAVRLEFASEVSRLHYSFLTCLIISRVRTARRALAPSGCVTALGARRTREHISGGKPWDRQRISGKLRRKFMSVPGLRRISAQRPQNG